MASDSSGSRIERLRKLLARLEQLPGSEERDRVLSEVRARTVDVDTGETPRAMLPVDPAMPPPETLERPPVAAPNSFVAPHRRRPARVPSAGQPPLAPPADPEPADVDERLSLEDVPAPPAHGPRPWEQGLRG